MLGSYRLLLLTKLILFELLGLMCIENNSFHRLLTSISHNNNSSINPLIIFVSVDDYFAVINCSTPDRVPHHKLDWYFQTRASIKPPRVIWQRGRSNIHRYIAYSPDQFRHFLQIKPLHSNDSGTYMCLDQTTGFYTRIELLVHDNHNGASNTVGLPMTIFICLVLLSSFLSRHTTSENQIT